MAGESAVSRAVASGHNDVVYLAPATESYEALPLGNGQLGVMLRNQRGLTWIFNHGSFFANAEQDNDLLSSGEVTLVTRYQTGRDTHAVTSWMAEGFDLLVLSSGSQNRPL